MIESIDWAARARQECPGTLIVFLLRLAGTWVLLGLSLPSGEADRAVAATALSCFDLNGYCQWDRAGLPDKAWPRVQVMRLSADDLYNIAAHNAQRSCFLY
jgi:hypothetical protein